MKNKIIPIMFLYLFASSTNASYKMLFENNVIKLPEKSIENSIESNEFFQHLRIQILDNNGDPNYVSLGDINWIIESNSYPSEVLTGYTNSPSPYQQLSQKASPNAGGDEWLCSLFLRTHFLC
jgi:hypothetical protein